MCPVGAVAADTEPELRDVAGEVIAGWVADRTRALRSAEPLLAAGHGAAAYIATLPVSHSKPEVSPAP